MNDKTYISWIMLCFLAAYLSLECMMRPPFRSTENAALLCQQVAWLVPMVPFWRWNAALRWNRKYFFGSLLVACGLLFGLMMATIPSHWSRSSIAAMVFEALPLGFVAGLFGLKARSMARALGIGAVMLVAQMGTSFLAFALFPSPVV